MGLHSRTGDDIDERVSKDVAHDIHKTTADDLHTGVFDAKKQEATPLPRAADNYQIGVQKVEAVTTIWKKWHLVAAYAMYTYPSTFHKYSN